MSVTEHMTAPAPRRSPPALLRVAILAGPLMVGTLAGAGLHVAKTGFLSHLGKEDALFTLAVVQPAFLLMLAFLEGLAIANQVMSSKSVNGWPLGDVRRATRAFTILGLIVTLALAGGFHAAGALLAPSERPFVAHLPEMGWFVLSLFPFLVFELRNGALRGQGRTAAALIPFAVLIVADLGVTWVALTRFDMGFEAVLLGNVVGPLVAWPLAAVMLSRTLGDARPGPTETYRKHLIGMTIGVAGPVGMTMLAGSASAAVLFPALAQIGSEPSSAFLVIVRLRILFMIPAIAMGSALAIVVNQLPERGHAAEKRSLLVSGLLAVAAIYGVATAALWLNLPDAVGLVVPADQAALNAVTLAMTTALIATFFLIALSTMIQVLLEHLGHGMKAFAATVAVEAATIAGCLWALNAGYALDGLVRTLNLAAGLGLLAFGIMFALSLRRIERVSSDAL